MMSIIYTNWCRQSTSRTAPGGGGIIESARTGDFAGLAQRLGTRQIACS